MKQAEAWGFGSMPTLNQTGELKRGDLVDEDRGELVVEGVAVGGGLEVAALLAVARDRRRRRAR